MRRSSLLQTSDSVIDRYINDDYSKVIEVADSLSTINSALVNKANIDIVANDISNVNRTAVSATEIDNVAANIANIDIVAGNIDKIEFIGDNLVNISAAGEHIDAINTVAGMVPSVNTVAANAVTVDAVGTNIVAVGTVADNILHLNNYYDNYAISTTEPIVHTDGKLWFDIANDTLKVYSSVKGWIAAGSSVNGLTETVEHIVGTPSGSYDGVSFNTFPCNYDVGYVHVYRQGFRLDRSSFTADDGVTIVLNQDAIANDIISIISFGAFELAAITNKENKTEKGQPYGYASLDSSGKLPVAELPHDATKEDISNKNIANGYAGLDADGEIDPVHFPSRLSNVVEAASLVDIRLIDPLESEKIYIAQDTNKAYRWVGLGTTMALLGSDLAIGDSSTTAYRGDYGLIAYTHSQAPHAYEPIDATILRDADISAKVMSSSRTVTYGTFFLGSETYTLTLLNPLGNSIEDDGVSPGDQIRLIDGVHDANTYYTVASVNGDNVEFTEIVGGPLSGTVGTAEWTSNIDINSVTLQGNSFNGSNELVRVTSDGKLPVLDGSNLTGLPYPLVAGVDYLAPTGDGSQLTGLQASLVAGVDYLAPDGDGSQLTGITPPIDQGATNFLAGDGTYKSIPTDTTKLSLAGGTMAGFLTYSDTEFTTNIDCSLGNAFSRTVTENFTQTFSNVPAPGNACVVTIKLINAGAYIIAWSSDIKWPRGIAPAFTVSGVDTVVLYTIDGGINWYGNAHIGYA